MNAIFSTNGNKPPRVSVIEKWHDDPNYLAALTAGIEEDLARFPDQDPSHTQIVFSAHSVPVSYIEEGDPYLDQTQATVRSVMARLDGDRPHMLSFQSKVGPVKWLRPSTDETLRKLAAEGATQVLLVPVSFVSEHIETLYELDILYKGVAAEVGITHYRRVPALNCKPDFIDALASLVESALALRAVAGRAVAATAVRRVAVSHSASRDPRPRLPFSRK